MQNEKLKMQKAKLTTMKRLVSSFCILHFAFLIAACAVWRAEPLQVATAEQLAALLRERQAEIRSMKGLFRVQISGLGLPIAQRLEGSVLFRRPNTYRLQGFDRMGSPLFDLTRGDDSYRLRLPTMGRVYNGPLVDLDRAERMGVPLRLTLLAMSGLIGTESVSKGDSLVLQEDDDRYRLDVLGPTGGGATRRLWFDRRSLLVIREDRFSPSGELEATVQFEDFRPIAVSPNDHASGRIPGQTSGEPMSAVHGGEGQIVKPFRITIQDGRGQGTLLLTFHEIVPNPTLDPTDLGLDTGKG
jgi:outer membrane lipoprotein-sorting protein